MSVSVNGFLKSECLALTEAVDFLARLGGGFWKVAVKIFFSKGMMSVGVIIVENLTTPLDL